MTDAIKIKITKCEHFMLWYKDRLNEEFEVVRSTQEHYWVREPDKYRAINFVLKQDAVVSQ